MYKKFAFINSFFNAYIVVSVGFDKKSYVCSEGDLEGCQMCVSILSPNYIDEKLFISLFAVSVAGTAEGKQVNNRQGYTHMS